MKMAFWLCIDIIKNYTSQIASSQRHKVSLSSSHKPNNSHKKTHPHTCSITTNWSVLNAAFQVLLYHETGAGEIRPLLCVACWHHITLSHWRHLSCAETCQTLSIYLSIFLVRQSAERHAYEHWWEYRGGCKLNKAACASLPSTANLNIDTSLTYTAMQLFAFWNIIWLKCWKTFHLFYSILTVKKWFKLM